MKMCLCTIFGVSSTFYISEDMPFQGLVQGNSTDPALWLIISMLLIRCLYNQKLVTSITSPISKLNQFIVDILHADDADLHVFNSGSDNTHDVFLKAQRLLNAGHEVLKLIIGDLKFAKFYWTL